MANEVSSKLNDWFDLSEEFIGKRIRWHIIKAYTNKESYGDMDIIIELIPGSGSGELVKIAKDIFGATDIVPNGKVVSFGYKNFQIDLIGAPSDEFDFSCNYFAYNDLCNLVGRISHKMGFKFGHDGLWYVYRDGDYVVKEILITQDFKKALEVFGFSHDEYLKGFNDLEDIYKYIVNNPYFNPDIYLLDNRNHTARVRDKKRKTYMGFLEWCKDGNNIPNSPYVFSTDKSVYLPDMFKAFKSFAISYSWAQHYNVTRLRSKEKFPMDLVRKHSGLEGKELGAYIAALKSQFDDSYDWHVFTLCLENDELLKIMDEEYAALSSNNTLNGTSISSLC